MKVGEIDRVPQGAANRSRWVSGQSVAWYRVVHAICRLLFRYWVRHLHPMHVDRIPSSGGAFLIANHTSGIDPFVLGVPVTKRMLRGPGRESLFVHPVFGYMMKKIGMFPLRQGTADAAAVRTMVELYRGGRVIIVYPEGGRSRTTEMRPFSPDFARLMLRLKAVVVPAGIAGAVDLLPIGARIPRPNSTVVVAYGEPLDLGRYGGGKANPEVAEEVANVMRDAVAQLVEEARAERARLLTASGS